MLRHFLQSTGLPSHGIRPCFTLSLVGEPGPPLGMVLPPNVQFVNVSLENIKRHLAHFMGTRMSSLLNKSHYAWANDLKPLFAALYPTLFAHCTWFGWVDTDMLVSSSRLSVLSEALAECKAAFFPALHLGPREKVLLDLGSPKPAWSWGPLTLLRGAAYYQQIMPFIARPQQQTALLRAFSSRWSNRNDDYAHFDEWGAFGAHGYSISFAGLIELARRQGVAIRTPIEEQACGRCKSVTTIPFTPSTSASRCHAIQSALGSRVLVQGSGETLTETLFCHFSRRKKDPRDPCSTDASNCGRRLEQRSECDQNGFNAVASLHHELSAAKRVSERPLVICAGEGTTGTRALAAVLREQFQMSVLHWNSSRESAALLRLLFLTPPAHYPELDFPLLLKDYDAV